jgi:hypothetical protein
MYQAVGADWVKSKTTRPNDLAAKLGVPHRRLKEVAPWAKPANIPGGVLPALFVINVIVPDVGPSMFSASQEELDDTGFCCAVWFAITPETLEMAHHIHDSVRCSNAVRLFAKYYARAAHDEGLRGQMRLMASVANADQLSLPIPIEELTCLCGTHDLSRDADGWYLEAGVDIGTWGYVTNVLVSRNKEGFPLWDLRMGVAIEGVGADQLPSRVLGGVAVHRLELNRRVDVFR